MRQEFDEKQAIAALEAFIDADARHARTLAELGRAQEQNTRAQNEALARLRDLQAAFEPSNESAVFIIRDQVVIVTPRADGAKPRVTTHNATVVKTRQTQTEV